MLLSFHRSLLFVFITNILKKLYTQTIYFLYLQHFCMSSVPHKEKAQYAHTPIVVEEPITCYSIIFIANAQALDVLPLHSA